MVLPLSATGLDDICSGLPVTWNGIVFVVYFWSRSVSRTHPILMSYVPWGSFFVLHRVENLSTVLPFIVISQTVFSRPFRITGLGLLVLDNANVMVLFVRSWFIASSWVYIGKQSWPPQ